MNIRFIFTFLIVISWYCYSYCYGCGLCLLQQQNPTKWNDIKSQLIEAMALRQKVLHPSQRDKEAIKMQIRRRIESAQLAGDGGNSGGSPGGSSSNHSSGINNSSGGLGPDSNRPRVATVAKKSLPESSEEGIISLYQKVFGNSTSYHNIFIYWNPSFLFLFLYIYIYLYI